MFDVFNEIEITGCGNWMFGTLSLGAFGDEEYHIMVRPMICYYIDAHRFRFKDFITGGFLLTWEKWGSRSDREEILN